MLMRPVPVPRAVVVGLRADAEAADLVAEEDGENTRLNIHFLTKTLNMYS